MKIDIDEKKVGGGWIGEQTQFRTRSESDDHVILVNK